MSDSTEQQQPDLMDVVEQYVDTFGEGPPIFELDDEQAVVLMLRAIADGIPMQDISTD